MHTTLLNVAGLSAGLLIGRLVLGLLLVGHGSQKLLGWFGGHGLAATGGFMESLGFHPGRTFAFVASATEIVSGLLIALGFLGPVGPALMLSVMIVAAVTVHWRNGLFATNNGIELALIYGTAGVALALTGFGEYSLDALAGINRYVTPGLSLAVLAVGALGGIANLFARRRPVAA